MSALAIKEALFLFGRSSRQLLALNTVNLEYSDTFLTKGGEVGPLKSIMELMTILSPFERIIPVELRPLDHYLADKVSNQRTGGILGLVVKEGEIIFCNNYGYKSRKNDNPMEFDDIFRIFSMTKPIACLTVLSLVFDGYFGLDDPIENYFPEFESKQVLDHFDKEQGIYRFRRASEKITIRQLFTQMTGHSYGLYPSVPIDLYHGKQLGFDYSSPTSFFASFQQWLLGYEPEYYLRAFADMPLAFEPGTHWMYGFNHAILTLLAEKVTNKPFNVLLRERILNPLGMEDTEYYVPTEKIHRLAAPFTTSGEGKLVELEEGSLVESATKQPSFCPGGMGLYSTLADYYSFCSMFLNQGRWENKQVVDPTIIVEMTRNHLPDNKAMVDLYQNKVTNKELLEWLKGLGYGLGVQVKVGKNRTKTPVGTVSWGGAANTSFWIDPKNEITGIFLTQCLPQDFNWIYPLNDSVIKNLVYEGLEKT